MRPCQGSPFCGVQSLSRLRDCPRKFGSDYRTKNHPTGTRIDRMRFGEPSQSVLPAQSLSTACDGPVNSAWANIMGESAVTGGVATFSGTVFPTRSMRMERTLVAHQTPGDGDVLSVIQPDSRPR